MASVRARGLFIRGGPRFYLGARLAFMLFAPAPLLFGFAPGTTTLQMASYTLGLALIELGGIVLLARWDRGRGLSGRLLAVLPGIDILGMAMMGLVATDVVPDPLYPAFLGLAVVYALLVPKRRALWIGIATGFAYVVVSFGQQSWQYFDLLVHLERVVCIPAVTWAVAIAVDLQHHRMQQLQLVADIGESLHASLDAEFLAEETVEQLADLIGLHRWCLSIIAEDGDVLFEAQVGGDAADETGADAPALVATPILQHEEAEAVFRAPDGHLQRLSAEERMVLDAVCRELLVAVENRRLFGQTKHLSVTDALTGLYNRRHLSCRVVEEIGRCRRFATSVSLLMVDGDDFKHVNDAYGHDVGDLVLAQLADLMVVSVREIDVVARYGGEEFCLLLPETDAEGALQVAEKLCATIEDHVFVNGVRLTVSIGVATFPESAESAEQLQRAADNALYAAKTSGKSRVCVHEPRAEYAS